METQVPSTKSAVNLQARMTVLASMMTSYCFNTRVDSTPEIPRILFANPKWTMLCINTQKQICAMWLGSTFSVFHYFIIFVMVFIILRVVLCCREMCSLREAHKQRMFENMVLWQICIPMKDEMREDWRKLCKEWFMVCNSDRLLIMGCKAKRMASRGHIAL